MTPTVRPSTRRLALLLGGLAMFGPFSIDTIFPAFPQMGAQLAADKVALQQTISVYLIAYALMSVVHGPLSDAIGRRRVILGGLFVIWLFSRWQVRRADRGQEPLVRPGLLRNRQLSGGLLMFFFQLQIRHHYRGTNIIL